LNKKRERLESDTVRSGRWVATLHKPCWLYL